MKTLNIGLVLNFVTVGGLFVSAPAVFGGTIPPGAAALGYTDCVINETPTAADIAPGKTGNYKWFSGQWYEGTPPPLSDYSTQGGALAISLGGQLVSAPLDFSTGALPTLSGATGFYVEFDVRLSGSDSDNWPAVWLMPVQHNSKQADHYSGDPAGYERWMELDVDEGGFGPGLTGTVHSWTGIYPNYVNSQNGNNVDKTALDRSVQHTFGASYDPVAQKVSWWVDGVEQMSAGTPYVPTVASQQDFYLLMTAASHGKNDPYTMYVTGVRAYEAGTALESWRTTYFGTGSNTGNAADTADPYHTGVSNIEVFAFLGPNQDPSKAGPAQLPQMQISGGNLFYSFTQPPGVSGVAYGAEWTESLNPANWVPVSDTGSGTTHIFSVPTSGYPSLFLRLNVGEP